MCVFFNTNYTVRHQWARLGGVSGALNPLTAHTPLSDCSALKVAHVPAFEHLFISSSQLRFAAAQAPILLDMQQRAAMQQARPVQRASGAYGGAARLAWVPRSSLHRRVAFMPAAAAVDTAPTIEEALKGPKVRHYIRPQAPWPRDVPIQQLDLAGTPEVDLVIAGAGPSGLAVGARVAEAVSSSGCAPRFLRGALARSAAGASACLAAVTAT